MNFVSMLKQQSGQMGRNKAFLGTILCFITAVFCVFVAGCGNSGVSEESDAPVQEKSSDAKISIGLSFDSFVIERWIRDRDVFTSTARELGADVNVQNANGDVEEQISQIRYLIDKQVDVLVVVAADSMLLADVMEEAHKSGIITISYDRLILNTATDLYLSFDNRKVGTLMAKALKEAIPEGGDIFMIQGAAEDNNVDLVREGFDEEIKESNLNVVYEANCAGWLSELGAEYAREALELYPDVKGIMCGNDDIASSVIRVLAEKRLAGEVAVVGQDGDLAACQRIVEGTQTMTAFKPVENLARAAAMYAVSMANGENPEERELTGTMDYGSGKVDCILLEPISVQKSNMKKIIVDGGYHSMEDVYLNVKNSVVK